MPTPNGPGADHLSLWVSGLDQILDHASTLGCRLVSATRVSVPDGRYSGSHVIDLRDPDGFVQGLIERPSSRSRP